MEIDSSIFTPTHGKSFEEQSAYLKKIFDNLDENEQEKKLKMDHLLKEEFAHYIDLDSTDEYQSFLKLIIQAVQNELCNFSTFFIILSDLFDLLTLQQSEVIFHFLEERVSIWKTDVFYNSGKNYLLRMCNDLLKRLSKSQNTIFSGQIQLFLAHLFPLEEKSGLNLMSNFNLDNVTTYSTAAESILNRDEDDLIKNNGKQIIDYTLYKKFWSMQEFFKKPSQCYEGVEWKTFVNYTGDVLNCFGSFKLDSIKDQKQKNEKHFFSKYLTSDKLLNLQLNDPYFRRNVLFQFLITFHYLALPSKFKTKNQVLNEDQLKWMNQTTEQVYSLLEDTPPDGQGFVKVVKHILESEDHWNRWKNEGCLSFVRKQNPNEKKIIPKSRKRSIELDMKTNSKLIKMGNPELTRLWNLCPDNEKACKSQERNFIKEQSEFFDEAISQLDPQSGIEDKYKLINDPIFAWKSLRILSKKSVYFFAQTQNNNTNHFIKTVPMYLENILKKIKKEINKNEDESNQSNIKEENKQRTTTTTTNNTTTEIKEEEEEEEEKEGEGEGEEEENDEDNDNYDPNLEGDLLELIVKDWKKFVNLVKMELNEGEVDNKTNNDIALYIFVKWKDSFKEKQKLNSKMEELINIL